MKKSNVIIFALLVVVSAFLLWLWFYLGFNKVDSPLDLVLSIVWWVLDALLIIGIIRLEKKRREQIRTIYVYDGALFNSETGLVDYDKAEGPVVAIQKVLDNLKYNFNKEDMPDDLQPLYVVESEKYDPDTKDEGKERESLMDASETDEDNPDWEGKVIRIDKVNGNVEKDFDDKTTLVALL